MDTAKLKGSLGHIVESFKLEIASLRTSRASAALIEGIPVECYGVLQPLKTVASIGNPGPRELVIQPWDKSLLPAIEKAIQSSNLGIQPIADKDTVRLHLPQLTEERRRELVKTLGKRAEEARIRVRREREEALRAVDRKEQSKELSEDEKFRRKQEIQKAVDETNRKIDEIASSKEKEIMTV